MKKSYNGVNVQRCDAFDQKLNRVQLILPVTKEEGDEDKNRRLMNEHFSGDFLYHQRRMQGGIPESSFFTSRSSASSCCIQF